MASQATELLVLKEPLKTQVRTEFVPTKLLKTPSKKRKGEEKAEEEQNPHLRGSFWEGLWR